GWYQAHDQPSDAVELLGQSLRVWQFLTGPAHPKVAQALGALAQAHLHAEHLQEADQLCERGLDILSSLLGDMPRASEFVQFSADDLAVARMSFASLLWTRGAVALRQDNALAVAFFGGRALLLLDLNDDEVGETLRPTLCTARAEVLRLLGHAATTDAEAEALFHRAMDQARTGEGDVLPSTLEDYADWLQAHGRPAEADQTRKDVDAWWEVNG
ncbi:MAG: tetratricopeptide repeat protein, partial [Chloroflexota bacterium]